MNMLSRSSRQQTASLKSAAFRAFNGSLRSHSTIRPSYLPNPMSVNWKFTIPFGLALGGTWYYFLLHVTNDERWSASVVKQVFKNLRENEEVISMFGSNISPEEAWWLPGQRPWVSGRVEIPRGVVDVSFRVHGALGSGTVYFTSIRKRKGADFTNLRYKVVGDDGLELDLLPTLQ